jgi:hypothetical protein
VPQDMRGEWESRRGDGLVPDVLQLRHRRDGIPSQQVTHHFRAQPWADSPCWAVDPRLSGGVSWGVAQTLHAAKPHGTVKGQRGRI